MNRKYLATWLTILVGLSAPCSAAMIVQTQGFVGQSSLRKTVEFDRFNPEYGELLSAEWRLLLDVNGGILTLDNDQPNSRRVDVALGMRGSVQSLDVTLVDEDMRPLFLDDTSVTATTGDSFQLDADDGDGAAFDPTGLDSITYHGGAATMTGKGLAKSSYLTEYLGTQMFQVTVDLESVLQISDDSGISSQLEPVSVSPTVVLIYEYAPVPELASGATLATGLICLVARGRRRATTCHPG